MVEECPADELTKFVQNINTETNEKTVAQTAQEIQHTFGSLKQVNICINDIYWYEYCSSYIFPPDIHYRCIQRFVRISNMVDLLCTVCYHSYGNVLSIILFNHVKSHKKNLISAHKFASFLASYPPYKCHKYITLKIISYQ